MLFRSRNLTIIAIPIAAITNLLKTDIVIILPNDLFFKFKALLNKMKPVIVKNKAKNHPNPIENKFNSDKSKYTNKIINIKEIEVILLIKNFN